MAQTLKKENLVDIEGRLFQAKGCTGAKSGERQLRSAQLSQECKGGEADASNPTQFSQKGREASNPVKRWRLIKVKLLRGLKRHWLPL